MSSLFSVRNVLVVVILLAILSTIAVLYLFSPQERTTDIPPQTTSVSDSVRPIPTFTYPETFGTTYVHPVDWPPTLQFLDDPFSCTEAGDETLSGGKTMMEMIGGNTYCVTRRIEGAAGSVYTLYAYGWAYEDGTALFTFSTRATQCGVYDEPERALCAEEQESFDPGALIDRIVSRMEVESDTP